MALDFIDKRTFRTGRFNGMVTGTHDMTMDDDIIEPVAAWMPSQLIVWGAISNSGVCTNPTIRINSSAGAGALLAATVLTLPTALNGNFYQAIALATTNAAVLIGRTADALLQVEVTVAAAGVSLTQFDIHAFLVGLVDPLNY